MITVQKIDRQVEYLRADAARLDRLNQAWAERSAQMCRDIVETLLAYRRNLQMTGMDGRPLE